MRSLPHKHIVKIVDFSPVSILIIFNSNSINPLTPGTFCKKMRFFGHFGGF